MSTVWVVAPYKPDSEILRVLSHYVVRPKTIGQSTKMILRPAVMTLFGMFYD